MRRFIFGLMGLLAFVSVAHADDGLITLGSAHSVKVTVDRLENALKKKGLTVFARIDHAAGARKVDKQLRPTELLIFGNPKVGTPLMQCARTMAIDLPQKALVWEDGAGKVWLAYNDSRYLAARHHMPGCDKVLNKVSKVLGKFSRLAVSAD